MRTPDAPVPDDLRAHELPDPRYIGGRPFHRCRRCHVPVWRDEWPAHVATCQGRARIGRPRKYPVGYRPPAHTHYRAMQERRLIKVLRRIGPLVTMDGELLLPLRLLAIRLGISTRRLRERCRHAGVPLSSLRLTSGPHPTPCLRESQLDLLDVVMGRVQNRARSARLR